MSNYLKNETSPYLLQHADNPVNWYPWGKEAFDKARQEDKPVFLSIGYSTCHWCHVMAHESFEDRETADILNQYFVSIKVDKEERPDIDSIYMTVCQTFTGSGGWPTTIFMTADQKPFFAGTYFPKTARYGSVGFNELLLAIHHKWKKDRATLLNSAEEVTAALSKTQIISSRADDKLQTDEIPDEKMQDKKIQAEKLQADKILDDAVNLYKHSFDKKYGGFGDAPKFPAPHKIGRAHV